MWALKKIQRGDIKEFERLFKELYSPLCAYANRFLRDADKAEEVVQDIFYYFWKDKEKRKISTSLKSYLYKTVQNKCLQLAEHQKVVEKYRSYISSKEQNFSSDPLDELQLKEMNKTIQNTLESLPDRCKEIFNLSRFEGLKYAEIATKLDISIKTVEANIGKALKAFRMSLKSE